MDDGDDLGILYLQLEFLERVATFHGKFSFFRVFYPQKGSKKPVEARAADNLFGNFLVYQTKYLRINGTGSTSNPFVSVCTIMSDNFQSALIDFPSVPFPPEILSSMSKINSIRPAVDGTRLVNLLIESRFFFSTLPSRIFRKTCVPFTIDFQ